MKHDFVSDESGKFLVINILRNELDMYNYSNIFSDMLNVLTKTVKNYIVIDFTKVHYMDSSFISGLVRIHLDLKRINKKLFLSSLNEEIIQIFILSNLHSLFHIMDTKETVFSSI